MNISQNDTKQVISLIAETTDFVVIKKKWYSLEKYNHSPCKTYRQGALFTSREQKSAGKDVY